MQSTMSQELATLQGLSPGELKDRYAALFGDTPRTGNKVWLLRRIAWRMQSLAEGDLSERARRRAMELANDADIRTSAPKVLPMPRSAPPVDDRVPPPGSVLTRNYKGRTLQVLVLKEGFEFEGETYPTLSALAKKVTGSHVNGFLFFGLTKRKEAKS